MKIIMGAILLPLAMIIDVILFPVWTILKVWNEKQEILPTTYFVYDNFLRY